MINAIGMTFKQMSLNAKLIAGFLILGMIPASILSWQVFQATNRMEQDLTKSFQSFAENINDKVDRNLFERYGDVQAFGANRAVFDKSSWYRPGSESNGIARVANRYAKLYGMYALLIMVDLNGRVIAVNDQDASGKAIDTRFLYEKDFKQAVWFQEVLAERFLSNADQSVTGTYVQDVYVDDDVKKVYGGDALTLGFSAPVKDEQGKVIGVWNNRAVFSVVEEILVSTYQDLKFQGYPTAELTLLNVQGKVLIDYDPSSAGGRGEVSHDLEKVVLKLNLAESGVVAAQKVIAGQSGGVRSLHMRKKVWQSCGFAMSKGALGYPGLKWGVLVRVPEEESLAVMTGIRHGVLWVLGFSVIGLAGVSWWLARSISRPLLSGMNSLLEGADQVASAASQVASSSQSLSQGATEQAASLEETSASMEEMAAMTRKNSENSTSAAQVMREMSTEVEHSNHSLHQMMTSMDAIKGSSGKVAKIIKTIDEIAFQTNILALNAAVEAARAGEAGKGFAVVADEVRNLAQRSAQAARDTTVLIEDSISNAKNGSSRLDQVCAAITAITNSVIKAKALVEEVSEAGKQQTQGIDQVTQAISQMEKVTQTTAANSEECAAAAQEMNAQSETTRSLIDAIRESIQGKA